jgi:di/tricarboxylate transporter
MGGSRLREDYNLTIIEVLRPLQPRSIARLGNRNLVLQSGSYAKIPPEAEVVFRAEDVLIAQSSAADISHIAAVLNVGVQPAHAEDDYHLISEEAGVAEVLLPPRSSLAGKTINELRFGSHYHLTVLGIQRPSLQSPLDLKNTKLRFGDTLLVQGTWKDILDLRKRPRDFVVMGQPEAMIGAPARARAPLAMLILAGMLVLMVTNLMPLVTASMLAALLMILFGCVSIDEAYESVDWKSIVLIAGMLPMSTALEKVGLVNLVSQGLTDSLGAWGPTAVLTGLFFLTSLFTQVLSNTATTVLIAPIGLAAARDLGVEPYAFLMAIAIAASMAFSTPVASPVNTLVMGAGNYRFSDYLRAGIPMILIMLVTSLIVLPILWPF